LVLEEGLAGEAGLEEEIEKPMRQAPAKFRDWSFCVPLYWAAASYFKLAMRSKENDRDPKVALKLIGRLHFTCKKLEELATIHKGVRSVSAICSGFLDVARGNSARACDARVGGFLKAVEMSTETGTILVAARARMETSRISREAVCSKISASQAALVVFQSSDALNDTMSCLLLLAQLDPTSAEYREMARVSMRRKSSSRKSKGHSSAVVNDLEASKFPPQQHVKHLPAIRSLLLARSGGRPSRWKERRAPSAHQGHQRSSLHVWRCRERNFRGGGRVRVRAKRREEKRVPFLLVAPRVY
jgi:hypothetical protein